MGLRAALGELLRHAHEVGCDTLRAVQSGALDWIVAGARTEQGAALVGGAVHDVQVAGQCLKRGFERLGLRVEDLMRDITPLLEDVRVDRNRLWKSFKGYHQ